MQGSGPQPPVRMLSGHNVKSHQVAQSYSGAAIRFRSRGVSGSVSCWRQHPIPGARRSSGNSRVSAGHSEVGRRECAYGCKHDAVCDAIASILIELVLAGTASLLARESKSLLLGERADRALSKAILRIAEESSPASKANGVIPVQLAPDQILAGRPAPQRVQSPGLPCLCPCPPSDRPRREAQQPIRNP
jgi:hypothetical protein